jgi:Single-strand binding protein family
MTIHALVQGTLFRTPEERIAKSGRPYVVATVKVKDGDAFQFVRATAFSESARAELLRLQDNDTVAVQGPLKVEQYISAADGKTKIGLSIVADQILPLRQPPKQRQVERKKPATATEPALAAPFDDRLDDLSF